MNSLFAAAFRNMPRSTLIVPKEYVMTTHKVGYFIGSLAKESINRKLAKALVRLAPPGTRNVGNFLQGTSALQLRL